MGVRGKFCKLRPSNCGKMIPRLVIMLKRNKIPRLKLYITIIFLFDYVFVKHLSEIMKVISISTKKDSYEEETYKSVPFLPTSFSFLDHYLNFQEHF